MSNFIICILSFLFIPLFPSLHAMEAGEELSSLSRTSSGVRVLKQLRLEDFFPGVAGGSGSKAGTPPMHLKTSFKPVSALVVEAVAPKIEGAWYLSDAGNLVLPLSYSEYATVVCSTGTLKFRSGENMREYPVRSIEDGQMLAEQLARKAHITFKLRK